MPSKWPVDIEFKEVILKVEEKTYTQNSSYSLYINNFQLKKAPGFYNHEPFLALMNL